MVISPAIRDILGLGELGELNVALVYIEAGLDIPIDKITMSHLLPRIYANICHYSQAFLLSQCNGAPGRKLAWQLGLAPLRAVDICAWTPRPVCRLGPYRADLGRSGQIRLICGDVAKIKMG